MIYPEFFPEDRKEEFSEKKVFEQLKKVSDKYDIFYSKKFVTDGFGKKPEYEIDFIISIPERAIICLEVKGGLINYNGLNDEWTQNGRIMNKRPDNQAISASHSLANSYTELIAGMPVGWGLCFPDCSLKDRKQLPTSIADEQIIDELSLLYLDKSLPILFDFIIKQYPKRIGVKRWIYEKFKNNLLRGIGFVQVLSAKIKYDEERFVELTNYQIELFKRVSKNKNIITDGPAGSGKTIVACALAQDFLAQDKRILFLCFNRTLANKIRYQFDRYEDRIEVSTFHSFARRIIDRFDKDWWNTNKDSYSDEFWNIEVPVKLEEYFPFVEERYDVLIIDEAQDFKEFWFELIFSLINLDGHKLLFMDEMQNIFNHFTMIPNADKFIKYSLPENCRNTKKIVKYLSEVINQNIRSFEKSPVGEQLEIKEFKNQLDEQKYLIEEIKKLTKEHGISPNQILILLNSSKAESCIDNIINISKLTLVALDNKARFLSNSIHYSTINTFKGLETDILFIVDLNKIDKTELQSIIYTEASRARHKLYLLSVNN